MTTYAYLCTADPYPHYQESPHPLNECRGCDKHGQPCPAPLKRVGPGSRTTERPKVRAG